jgi:hypothetical protein
MSDEQFEEFLKREAQAYNPPPAAVPREEMWETIRARRAANASSTRPASSAPRVGGAMPTRSDKPTLRFALIGMAATLLLGIGIGRYAMQRDDAVTELASQIESAMTGQTTSSSPFPDSMPDGPRGASDRPDGSLITLAAVPSSPTRRRVPSAVVARSASGDAEPDAAMQIVSRDHLSRAEALVSVVAASPADAAMDSLTGRWARDMLTNTRLLLDSPAGDDPVRRRLLEDLETVLVQLLQRTGGAVDERALIDRTLERTQLLSRLRSGAAGI